MSLAEDLLVGLTERLATLPGLTSVLTYEPTSVEPPMIYSLLDEVVRVPGAITTRRYRYLHRLVIAWIGNDLAEAQLLSYVDPVAAAIDADPFLGARIACGSARITDQQAGFVVINKTLYRVLDSYSECVTKGRFQQ